MELLTLRGFLERGARCSAPVTQKGHSTFTALIHMWISSLPSHLRPAPQTPFIFLKICLSGFSLLFKALRAVIGQKFCARVGNKTSCDERNNLCSKPGLAEAVPPLPPCLHSAEEDEEQQGDLIWICTQCLHRFLEDI